MDFAENGDGAFWHRRAMGYAEAGDALLAENKLDEARDKYRRAAQDEVIATNHAATEHTRLVLRRSTASLWILAGSPGEAERIAMKEIAGGIESAELRAEFRTIIRDAWKAEGITAKSDRAESDAFVVQRRRVRAGIKRMLAEAAEQKGGAK